MNESPCHWCGEEGETRPDGVFQCQNPHCGEEIGHRSPFNNPVFVRVELITVSGNEYLGLGPRRVLVAYNPPEWAGFPIRAWFWNTDLDQWDEINHQSTLMKIREVADDV